MKKSMKNESFISGNWIVQIQTSLDKMVLEKQLPEKSLTLKPNFGRDGKTITSYSVCIYEPNYPPFLNTTTDPTRNTVVLNIREVKQKYELTVATKIFENVGKIPSDAEEKQMTSDTNNTHINFPRDSKALVQYIMRVTEYCVDNYESKSPSFGCCDRYLECSDVKQCVLENKLYSKACKYRSNLESGRVFYGRNRNTN